jgi:hypothetical protein
MIANKLSLDRSENPFISFLGRGKRLYIAEIAPNY